MNFALAPVSVEAEVIVNGRPAVVLNSPAAKLVVDLGGGSIVDFHLAGDGLNPLRWIDPADENALLRPMAHFLCLIDGVNPPRLNCETECRFMVKRHASGGESSMRQK